MNRNEELFFAIFDRLNDGVYFVDRDRKITYWNRAARRITGFTCDQVVGRNCMHNILNHMDEEGTHLCLGDCLLASTLGDGKEREGSAYFHHSEGHRVPVHVRVLPIRDDEGNIEGAVEIFKERINRANASEDGDHRSSNTGGGSLRYLWDRPESMRALAYRFEEINRSSSPSGLLTIDLDGFQQLNQIHGAQVGDRVLQMAAASILNSLRPFDYLNRGTGADFVAMVTNASGKEVQAVADRVRILLEHSSLLRTSNPIRVTATIGATDVRTGDTLEGVVQRARDLLQMGKEAGGNRVMSDFYDQDRSTGARPGEPPIPRIESQI